MERPVPKGWVAAYVASCTLCVGFLVGLAWFSGDSRWFTVLMVVIGVLVSAALYPLMRRIAQDMYEGTPRGRGD